MTCPLWRYLLGFTPGRFLPFPLFGREPTLPDVVFFSCHGGRHSQGGRFYLLMEDLYKAAGACVPGSKTALPHHRRQHGDRFGVQNTTDGSGRNPSKSSSRSSRRPAILWCAMSATYAPTWRRRSRSLEPGQAGLRSGQLLGTFPAVRSVAGPGAAGISGYFKFPLHRKQLVGFTPAGLRRSKTSGDSFAGGYSQQHHAHRAYPPPLRSVIEVLFPYLDEENRGKAAGDLFRHCREMRQGLLELCNHLDFPDPSAKPKKRAPCW